MNPPFLLSPLGETPVIMEADFNTSVSRLFKAWTNADDIKAWFGSDEGGPEHAEINLNVNGRWQFAFTEKEGQQDILSGRYIEIEENKKLVFSWVHTRILPNGETEVSPESRISIAFESRDNGAALKLIHTNISSDSARTNIGGGWSRSFMKLKKIVE